MSIGVLVVDDSALIRSLLSEIINQQTDMHVVGVAKDAYVAKEMVNSLSPDVITLDIEMPKVNGLTFLDKLMKARPTPVLMISTLTEQGAEATLRALELGAIDYIAKPKLGVSEGISVYQQEIVDKIRLVFQAKVFKSRVNSIARKNNQFDGFSKQKIIAIGASTGGCEAIKIIIESLPINSPPVVITQHMPAGFTASFAQRLNNVCKVAVKEAQDGEVLVQGTVYIAPGNKHLLIVAKNEEYRVKLDEGEPVSGHKPSVDVMFSSLAQAAGKQVAATILTGMGKDGAKGLLALRQSGAYTVAQSESSCVIYGMPKEAVKISAAIEQTDLDLIAQRLLERTAKPLINKNTH
jgi:two-component system chemotaxis response regulator CheB